MVIVVECLKLRYIDINNVHLYITFAARFLLTQRDEGMLKSGWMGIEGIEVEYFLWGDTSHFGWYFHIDENQIRK